MAPVVDERSRGLIVGLAAAATGLAVLAQLALLLGVGEPLREEWWKSRSVAAVAPHLAVLAFPLVVASVTGAWAAVRHRSWAVTWLTAATGALVADFLIAVGFYLMAVVVTVIFVNSDWGF
ncbi:MAG TPA: hypothetical protein VGR21_00235 [Cryptosporangiaceae bacterium]|nr:hypothetical protein [Cryptosporangiaceae bacterium]